SPKTLCRVRAAEVLLCWNLFNTAFGSASPAGACWGLLFYPYRTLACCAVRAPQSIFRDITIPENALQGPDGLGFEDMGLYSERTSSIEE
ncbi:MAG: hypothetical protein IJT05_02635, partial [Lachnospiraceae bacterium]|nr:hypothetical protein [Lachnospiraceae bacterium]